jgi:hypothetical protein
MTRRHLPLFDGSASPEEPELPPPDHDELVAMFEELADRVELLEDALHAIRQREVRNSRRGRVQYGWPLDVLPGLREDGL